MKMCEQNLKKRQRTNTIQILWIVKNAMTPIIAAIASRPLKNKYIFQLYPFLSVCILVSLLTGPIQICVKRTLNCIGSKFKQRWHRFDIKFLQKFRVFHPGNMWFFLSFLIFISKTVPIDVPLFCFVTRSLIYDRSRRPSNAPSLNSFCDLNF